MTESGHVLGTPVAGVVGQRSPIDAIIELLGILLILYIPMIGIGKLILRGAKWALWLAFLFSIVVVMVGTIGM